MIKECKVVLHNSVVTVVDFNGTHVQFPAIKSIDKTVYVENINGKYTIVSKDDYEMALKPKTEKKSKKVKVTETNFIEDVAEPEAVKNEADEISE